MPEKTRLSNPASSFDSTEEPVLGLDDAPQFSQRLSSAVKSPIRHKVP
jgi:hypothetical protein